MTHDRRTFLGIGGAGLLCTLAGQRVRADGGEADLAALAANVPDPPSLSRASARPVAATAQAPGTQRREYWIQAEPVKWNIVPTKRDGMMDEKVKGRTRFTALCYRQYTANWAAPVGPAAMPGPLLEAQTGDTLVVNFRNKGPGPVTMHPHGVFYTADMDGAYKGRYTDPGGFVKPGKSFQYVWDCRPGTEGVWPYHDHGPLDPLPLYKGLFGLIHVRKPDVPRPDVDHYVVFHSLLPVRHRARAAVHDDQRPRLRRQHADAARAGRPAGGPARRRAQQRLPHLPPARAPLDGPVGPRDRQRDDRPGRLVLARVRRGQPGPLVLPLPRLQPPPRGDERVVRGRPVSRGRRPWRAAAVAAAAAGLAVTAGPAGATSRKVAIGDFQWSIGDVQVDRGDTVTWVWVGPDTQHSVTGLSDNALALDSDPGNGAPDHRVGDRFTLRFDRPGTYEFHCKLHAIVRGQVVVSDTPGTGAPSPDPDPPITEDLTPPELTGVSLGTSVLRRGRPAELRYTLDERARLTFDVVARRHGRAARRLGPWRLVGTKRFRGHIGWNTFDWRGTLHGRALAPGRYRGILVAADAANNHTRDVSVPFRVRR